MWGVAVVNGELEAFETKFRSPKIPCPQHGTKRRLTDTAFADDGSNDPEEDYAADEDDAADAGGL